MKKFLFIFFVFLSFYGLAQTDTLVVVGDNTKTRSIALSDSSIIQRTPFDTTRGSRFKRVIKNTSSTFLKVVGIDTLTQRDRPRITFLRSMVIPGTGQIMNKDYLKVPLVYLAAAGGVYAIRFNNKNYHYYLNHVRILENNKQTSMVPLPRKGQEEITRLISKETYARAAANYRRNRDYSWIGFGLGWTLFAVEANVAAHLKTFDISDDISMKWSPTVIPGGGMYTAGVKLSLNFN